MNVPRDLSYPWAVYERCADLGYRHGLEAGPDAECTDESWHRALVEYWESEAIDEIMEDWYGMYFVEAWPFSDRLLEESS